MLLERMEQVTNDITQDEWKLYHFVCNRVLFVRGEERNGQEFEYSLSPSAELKFVCKCTFIKRSNFGGYSGREKYRSSPQHFSTYEIFWLLI